MSVYKPFPCSPDSSFFQSLRYLSYIPNYPCVSTRKELQEEKNHKYAGRLAHPDNKEQDELGSANQSAAVITLLQAVYMSQTTWRLPTSQVCIDPQNDATLVPRTIYLLHCKS